MLLLVIALTCGLSGRGPEMMSLTYMNTLVGDRGLTLKGGQFMAITEYHKSQAMMDVLTVGYQKGVHFSSISNSRRPFFQNNPLSNFHENSCSIRQLYT